MSVLAILMFQAGGLGSMSGLSSLALPVVFIAAMYFLMIAPNQKKQKAWAEMLASIKTGDRVTTSGGLRGVVLQVKDDIVVLRLQPDNIKLEFVKSAIASVSTEEREEKAECCRIDLFLPAYPTPSSQKRSPETADRGTAAMNGHPGQDWMGCSGNLVRKR